MLISALKEAWNFVDRPLKNLFGLLLLYSYYEFLTNVNSMEIFWGAIKGNLRKFYMISLVVAIVEQYFLTKL